MKTMATLALMGVFAQHPANASMADANSLLDVREALSAPNFGQIKLQRMRNQDSLAKIKKNCSDLLSSCSRAQSTLDRVTQNARELSDRLNQISSDNQTEGREELSPEDIAENKEKAIIAFTDRIKILEENQSSILDIQIDYNNLLKSQRKLLSTHLGRLRKSRMTNDFELIFIRSQMDVAVSTIINTIDGCEIEFAPALNAQNDLILSMKSILAKIEFPASENPIESTMDMDHFLSSLWD